MKPRKDSHKTFPPLSHAIDLQRCLCSLALLVLSTFVEVARILSRCVVVTPASIIQAILCSKSHTWAMFQTRVATIFTESFLHDQAAHLQVAHVQAIRVDPLSRAVCPSRLPLPSQPLFLATSLWDLLSFDWVWYSHCLSILSQTS